MIRLAVDTAFEHLSLALTGENELLAEFHSNERRRNATILFQQLENLIVQTRLKLEQIDVYVVNQGPGSYTGVRIGMALVKTMAQIFNKPVVPVNSLMLLASQIRRDKTTFPVLLNCTQQDLFVATFRIKNGQLSQLSPIRLYNLFEVLKIYGDKPVLLHRIKPTKDKWSEEFLHFQSISLDRPGVNANLLDQVAAAQIKSEALDLSLPVHPLYVKRDVGT